MEAVKQSLGLSTYLDSDYATAVTNVTAALKEEGFGILTEIDVKATLKQKIDVDFRPYVILGACNPPLAHRALSAAAEVGLLLPCNVVVAEEDDGRIWVSAINPEIMLSVIDDPALEAVACDARARLERAINSLN